jgi:hypothetical protein
MTRDRLGQGMSLYVLNSSCPLPCTKLVLSHNPRMDTHFGIPRVHTTSECFSVVFDAVLCHMFATVDYVTRYQCCQYGCRQQFSSISAYMQVAIALAFS